MRTIKSQTWRRKLDRSKPNWRSNEWVVSAVQSERTVPLDVQQDFERIVAQIAVKKSTSGEHNTSS
jgi:hypothetical protein